MASLISSMVALTLSSAISSKSNALLIALTSGLQFIIRFACATHQSSRFWVIPTPYRHSTRNRR
ncbi:Uncharacterised protein [Raoultella terrigena]|uniref:Uncharacterized protein n=1 Tax=Raoultella terrigena TaxID=577 RepID=A0A4U9DGE0_RAOTE|nr:Uncharacterised protein [Raoultella terrigena]